MGAKQGELLATDIFLETGQEGVKISCKSPDIAFVSNSPRKHIQGLGNEIVPWMWLVSKSHLSLSLLASSSFTFSRILHIQGYICWSMLSYSIQESSQFLSPRFSISLPNSYQIWKHFTGNNSSVCMEIFHLAQCTPILPLSALHTDRWPSHLYCVLHGHRFDSQINIFSTTYT